MKSIKLLVFFSLSILSLTSMATQPVEVCLSNLPNLDDEGTNIELVAEIYENYAMVTMENTEVGKYGVKVSEFSIRSDLSESDIDSELNGGESIILHAMLVQEDPTLKDLLYSGVNLKKVKNVKLFQIGKRGNLGSFTVVRALDKDKKRLGSFVGGLLVSPCK